MRARQGGFTLLEALVATVILAVAITGLLSSLTTSLRTAGRVTEADRAAVLARRKMDELLQDRTFPRGAEVTGAWEPAAGLEGGWRARLEPFEAPPDAGDGVFVLDRMVLEVWWMSGGDRRRFTLEGYKTTMLQPAGGGQ